MDLAGGIESSFNQVVENVVGAGARGRQVDMRRVLGRGLEQAGHHGGFGHRNFAHRLAEIILRGRFDAEGAAAHVGAIEIHFQDFAFCEPALEQERQKHFLDLALERALGRQE